MTHSNSPDNTNALNINAQAFVPSTSIIPKPSSFIEPAQPISKLKTIPEDNDKLYNQMEIDTNEIDENYQTINQKINKIQEKYPNDKQIKNIRKRKGKSKKFSTEDLLRSRNLLT
eukprot:898773_1